MPMRLGPKTGGKRVVVGEVGSQAMERSVDLTVAEHGGRHAHVGSKLEVLEV